jgi:hypothetical protein
MSQIFIAPMRRTENSHGAEATDEKRQLMVKQGERGWGHIPAHLGF